MMRVLSAISAVMLTSAASAQYDNGTYLFEVVGGPVSPSNPSVTVRLYAAFPKVTSSTAYGNSNLDIVSSDPMGYFSDLAMGSGLPLGCSLAQLGTPTPQGGVSGMAFAQIGVVGCVPSPTLPMLLWEATWTTSNFESRTVEIGSTNTSLFRIFSSGGPFWPDIELYPDKFEHGTGVIQVIPAPATLCLTMFAAGIAMRRGRR